MRPWPFVMTSLFRLPALVLLLAPPAGAAPPQDTPSSGDLLSPALRDLLHEGLSGELAKEHVIEITRHHRIQGSRGYRAAGQYVLQQLRGFGYEAPSPEAEAAMARLAAEGPDAEGGCSATAGAPPTAWIESFPSDGRVVYQTWQSPSGWDIDEAELRLMEPCDDPAGERIVGYPEIAMSVITYSNAGDVTADLVWVASGEREEDYAGKDVTGKFVLATGYGGAVHRLAVLQHGAAAVVCFLDDGRATDHPDMLQYTGMWPKTAELERTTFGFNLTHRQGARLRDLLLAGQTVTLRGRVKGKGLEPYFMDVVVAQIPGAAHPDEVLVFSAHLDHPKESANDNASGSGAILDIARTLRRLVDEGRLPRPQRTLRFLWVPEWNGTMAYIDAHPEVIGPGLGGKVLANLNLDMVGENLELLHSKLILTRTPASLPSCLDDVVENMAQMVGGMDVRTPRGGASAFHWRMTPYSGGSDHMMFLDRRVPAVMFSHDPDYTHHTSEDTPDKVDPVELERCEIIAAATALYLSDVGASEEQARDLLNLVAAGSSARLGAAGRAIERSVTERAAAADRNTIGTVGAFARAALRTRADREAAAIGSVAAFHPDPALVSDVEAQRQALLRQAQDLAGRLDATCTRVGCDAGALVQIDPDWRVPVRLTRGPLDFGLPESRLPPEDAAFYHSPAFTLTGDMRFELVNFIDGSRDLERIAEALGHEFDQDVRAQVIRYLDDLVKVGVVTWKP